MCCTDRRGVVRVLAMLIASATTCAARATGARADELVEAVWKEQHMTFAYRSAGPVHTCAGLRTQLRSLLRTLGVRESVTITVTGCEQFEAPRSVSVALVSPVEATAENLSDLVSRSPSQELAARVRGTGIEAPQSPARFPARWRTISFAGALHLRLTPADCELLKQLRRELMPKLAVRVVSDRMRCPGDLASGYRPQLVVSALVAD